MWVIRLLEPIKAWKIFFFLGVQIQKLPFERFHLKKVSQDLTFML